MVTKKQINMAAKYLLMGNNIPGANDGIKALRGLLLTLASVQEGQKK